MSLLFTLCIDSYWRFLICMFLFPEENFGRDWSVTEGEWVAIGGYFERSAKRNFRTASSVIQRWRKRKARFWTWRKSIFDFFLLLLKGMKIWKKKALYHSQMYFLILYSFCFNNLLERNKFVDTIWRNFHLDISQPVCFCAYKSYGHAYLSSW